MQKDKPKTNFVNFIRKLEGKEPEYDLFFAKERLGSRLFERYDCLLELLAGHFDISTYSDRVWSVSDSKRQDCFHLRRTIGFKLSFDQVGVYVTDRSFLRKAVEQILSDHQGEQQETVSDDSSREPTRTSVYNDSISSIIGEYSDHWVDFTRYVTYDTPSSTPNTPRSREEPVRNDATRYRADYISEQSSPIRRMVRE